MEPDSSIWGHVLLLAILILCKAFFSMSEMAIITLNDNKIRKMAEDGNKKARQILKLVEEPSRFLSTIQVGVTISGMLASAFAADSFTKYIVYALGGVNISPPVVRGISLVVITFVLSYFTLVIGELVPKRLAMHNAEKISFLVTWPLTFFYKIGRPFVSLLSRTTNGILRMCGIDPSHKTEEVTEEEIRMMIDVGNESGNIEASNKDMINNIFEFDDRTVIETMTHRTEMVAVELEDPLEEIVEIATSTGYSRIPVYKEDPDSIVGILYVKDLLKLVMQKDVASFDLKSTLREPLYVPESTNCKLLLKDFQERKIQMAIVVDEYGGTSGIVTMEDLLESIVGNIQDEYDDEDEEIAVIADNCYLVDGLAPVEGVGKFFGIRFPDDEDYETIGGYMLGRLGYIPSGEDHPAICLGNVTFTVAEMDERRISKLQAERVPAPETATDSPEKS